MSRPSVLSYIRQILGRALRETGQALDRVGARGQTHATTMREVGDDAYTFNKIISRHRTRMELLTKGAPRVHVNTFIAPCSHLIGSVAIGEGSSVWYGAVIRADRCRNGLSANDTREIVSDDDYFQGNDNAMMDYAKGTKGYGGGVVNIGKGSNVQDGVIISSKRGHTNIGDGVTIGHSAQIDSATIESDSLIGMGAIICAGAHVESNSFVAAGAVVGGDVRIPSGELWAGTPAKKLRDLTDAQIEKIKYQASEYVKLSTNHMHVMELGGNVPDSKIEHLVTFPLEAGDNSVTAEQNDNNEFKDDNKVPISAEEGKASTGPNSSPGGALSDEQRVSKGAAASA
mmetsp:Transcript_28250/g.43954  ORF Transcript_28250/g.43954 Transcript_28250/m.43954 type:complete len:343 (-) Transcript_28250:64-1092(-)